MIINSQELESILNREFIIGCPSIELFPEKTDPSRGKYTGSGSLAIKKEGYFELKLYSCNEIPFDKWIEQLDWKSGEIIPRKYFYSLIATDFRGRKWLAEGILPDVNTGPGGSIITGKIKQLSSEMGEPIINRNAILLMFEGEINVPMNLSIIKKETIGDEIRRMSVSVCLAKFSAIDVNFEIEYENGWTKLTAQSNSVMFDDIIVSRIIEAFQFITARTQLWTVMQIWRDNLRKIRIRANEVNIKESSIGPPIVYNKYELTHNVWLLFGKYLGYISKEKNKPLHPISSLIKGIIESGKSSIEAQVLTLGVSIESFLRNEFNSIFIRDTELNNDIKCSIELIKNSCLRENFKKRIIGSLSAMENIRSKDYLYKLAERNLISIELVKIYGERRNKSIHEMNINWGDLQNLLNQIFAMLVLFYQLVFLKIEYTGVYTDYSTYNWPRKEFCSILS